MRGCILALALRVPVAAEDRQLLPVRAGTSKTGDADAVRRRAVLVGWKRCKDSLGSGDETRSSGTRTCCMAGRGVVSGAEAQSSMDTLLQFSV